MSSTDRTLKLGKVDSFLATLDEGVMGALYRAVIGFALVPLVQFLTGRDATVWTLVGFLLLVLVALRVGPAVIRKLVRFSPELLETWSVRRRRAKLYDSYQWRKMLWIGAGIALFVALSGQVRTISVVLSLFCLIVGVAAKLRWRAILANPGFAMPVARKMKTTVA